MPVDKFGKNGDRKTPGYTGNNIANLTKFFKERWRQYRNGSYRYE